MAKVVCPVCGQDYVVKAHIKALSKDILLCPECDSYWDPNETIAETNAKAFYQLRESNGLPLDGKLLDFGDPVIES